MKTTTQAKFRVLGENDDASECACCGRQGLLRVVWMQELDGDGEELGEPVPFGRVCAARAAGWGYGSRSSLDKRIAQELTATRKHFGQIASQRIAELEASGQIKRASVAYAFDFRSAEHRYGYIFILPGDRIESITDPVLQQAEIKAAKARRDEAYPVCKWMEGSVSLDDLRAMLA